jgi:hypothetical protein
MTKKEEKKLVEQIKRLCEKQYRKGLQHGVGLAIEKGWTEKNAQIFRWVGERQGYKKVRRPENAFPIGNDKFLVGECAMKDMEELSRLLQNY